MRYLGSRCDCCGHFYRCDPRRKYDVWLCAVCAADHFAIDGDADCGRLKGWQYYCGWDRRRLWRYFADRLCGIYCGWYPKE